MGRNYYRNNLQYAFKTYVVFCCTLVTIGAGITFYIVSSNINHNEQQQQNTFVLNSNGASIHVLNPEQLK